MEGSSNGGMLYHEVQESKLCAVHCVNTALQGPFFLEFDFAALASELDLQGLTRMKKRRATCECGTRETTAELAASLSVSAARRIVEADEFMRAGLYDGWLPNLFVGNLLKGLTVGVIGAGRIGSAYARMMVGNIEDVDSFVQYGLLAMLPLLLLPTLLSR